MKGIIFYGNIKRSIPTTHPSLPTHDCPIRHYPGRYKGSIYHHPSRQNTKRKFRQKRQCPTPALSLLSTMRQHSGKIGKISGKIGKIPATLASVANAPDLRLKSEIKLDQPTMQYTHRYHSGKNGNIPATLTAPLVTCVIACQALAFAAANDSQALARPQARFQLLATTPSTTILGNHSGNISGNI